MPRKIAIWQTGLRLTTRFLVVIESKPHTFALVSTDVKDRQFPILFLREREREQVMRHNLKMRQRTAFVWTKDEGLVQVINTQLACSFCQRIQS